MRKKFIGLSMSFCMRDIFAGKIKIDEISAIVTSTAFFNWNEAFEYHYEIYWNDFDKSIALRLFQEVWPLICQPRMQVGAYEHNGHSITHGFWLNTETGELTKHFEDVSKDHTV